MNFAAKADYFAVGSKEDESHPTLKALSQKKPNKKTKQKNQTKSQTKKPKSEADKDI